MRIVVNDIAASEGGALTVLRDFYEEIRSSNDNNEWIFLLNDYYFEETENIKIKLFSEVKKSWFKRLYFELFEGKKIINKLNPDVYFSLQNTATIGVRAFQIVYLHQSIPYQKEKNFSLFKRDEQKLAVYQKLIGKLFEYTFKKTKAKIIVQSKWMQRAIKQRVNNEVIVVPPRITIPKEISEKLRPSGKVTFFYPASESKYKNHQVIYTAVDYIVQRGYKDFQIVLTIPTKKIFNQKFYKFIGKIPRNIVFEYYADSILLFPSYIETYGLPLKEATFFNTPIIASKTDFSAEILGNYNNVTFFDKYDSTKLADIMIAYITNTNKTSNSDFFNELDDTNKTNLLNVIINVDREQ